MAQLGKADLEMRNSMEGTTNSSSIARRRDLALSASYITTMGRPVPVVITARRSQVRFVSVVFFISPRTKERLLQVISTAFVGWLVIDGYGAYRWYDHRQRCLAHLIRKALALSQAVDAEARQLGQWLLEEMRELIHALATAGHDDPDDPGTLGTGGGSPQ